MVMVMNFTPNYIYTDYLDTKRKVTFEERDLSLTLLSLGSEVESWLMLCDFI